MPLVAAAWWPHGDPSFRMPGRVRRVWRATRVFRLGYVAGFIFFVGAFHWLATLGVLYQSAALYALPPLLALYMAVYFGFWCWFLRLIARPGPERFTSSVRNLGLGVAGASAWVAGEWVRSWLFSGFSWNMLGVAVRGNIAMIQIADITGIAGLSWLAAL